MLSCKKQRIVVVQRSTAQGIAANFMDTTMQQASLLCSTEESIFSLLMLLNFTECFYFVNIFLTVSLLILECNILAFKVKV